MILYNKSYVIIALGQIDETIKNKVKKVEEKHDGRRQLGPEDFKRAFEVFDKDRR